MMAAATPSQDSRTVILKTADGCEQPLSDSAAVDAGSPSVLELFNETYQSIHGYLSLTVCAFGILSNALNVVVLTRRPMVNATNCLLTALAVTDLLTMCAYVPYAGYFYCYASPTPDYGHRLGWILYLIFNNHFSITAHTVAVWLTVSIAVFRYIVVCGRHALGARLCSRHRAKVAIGAVVAATVVACVPNYVMYRPVLYDMTATQHHQVLHNVSAAAASVNGTATRCFLLPSTGSELATVRTDIAASTPSSGSISNESLAVDDTVYWFGWNWFVTDTTRTINFWLFGVVMKVVPCVLLTVLSAMLVRAMRHADRRRRRLLSQGRRVESDRAGERNRTTAMLVAVVLCFVVTELPQGVLALLSGFYTHLFYAVYAPLGDFWDILVLINSAINFVVYCTMNRRFRYTVTDVFYLTTFHKGRGLGVASGCDRGATELGTTAASNRIAQCRTRTTAAVTTAGGGRANTSHVTLAVYSAGDAGKSDQLPPDDV